MSVHRPSVVKQPFLLCFSYDRTIMEGHLEVRHSILAENFSAHTTAGLILLFSIITRLFGFMLVISRSWLDVYLHHTAIPIVVAAKCGVETEQSAGQKYLPKKTPSDKAAGVSPHAQTHPLAQGIAAFNQR
ncbi:hypothetical protein PC123_g8767 [Phytophthora cactorum]|nr:hypothetical protein PC123_g8767 [Phytophthora cactorum]